MNIKSLQMKKAILLAIGLTLFGVIKAQNVFKVDSIAVPAQVQFDTIRVYPNPEKGIYRDTLRIVPVEISASKYLSRVAVAKTVQLIDLGLTAAATGILIARAPQTDSQSLRECGVVIGLVGGAVWLVSEIEAISNMRKASTVLSNITISGSGISYHF